MPELIVAMLVYRTRIWLLREVKPVVNTFKTFLTHILKRPLSRRLALSYLVYCTLTGVIAQPLLNHYAGAIYTEQTGRTLHYDLISFNPLSLTLSMSHVRDFNPDGSLFWQVDRAEINLSVLRSLALLTPGLDAFVVRGLQAHLTQNISGDFNFADIIAHQSTLATANNTQENTQNNPSDDALPRFFIEKLRLNIRALTYTEERKKQNFSQSIEQLAFRLDNFSTRREKNQPYTFKAQLGDLGKMEWRGDLSLKHQKSRGEFSLKNISLTPISDYLDETLAAHITKGSLSLQGGYSLNWGNTLDWSLNRASAELQDFNLGSDSPNDLNADIKQLIISGVNIASSTKMVSVEHIATQGISLKSWSDANEVGLTRALSPTASSSPNNSVKPAQANTQIQPSEETNWAVNIQQFNVENTAIDWTLRDQNSLNIALNNIAMIARNIDSTGITPTQFELSAILASKSQQGRALVQGEMNLIDLNGKIHTELDQLPLSVANPVITQFVAGEITQGSLSTTADIELLQGAPTQVLLNGSLNQFLLKPKNLAEEALRFNKLSWENTHIDLTQSIIDGGNITLQQLDGRFIITKAGTTNIDALLIKNSDAPSKALDPQESDSTSSDWRIGWQSFTLDDASFRFHDESLTPKFTAAVQNFSGSLDKLDSHNNTPAEFRFKGNVDGYAPVTLNGQMHPFLAKPLVKAKFSFAHLDLGALSTYSSTYAGWRIDRGQLSADLDYQLADDRIRGDNHVVMEKLQLGERIRSAQAMDIPLRLALAMITDANGRAVLDIGVSGDINEPSFHIGKLIRDAITNSITKLVTSPFRLLAGLVGSDEDLGVLPFNSGSSAILATANRRLHSLQTALNQRPDLRIELLGRVDPISDTRGLQAAYAKQALLASGLSQDDIKQKNEHWEITVKKLYRRVPEKRVGDLTADEVYEDWLTTFAVSDTELHQLAVARATKSKQFLVQNLELDPARIFINSSETCSEEDPTQCRRRITKIELHNTWEY